MSGTDRLTIRSCDSHQELKVCVDLQRRIWGFEDADLVPAALFVVAQHTGGHAYCAFDGDKAVGFALAFSADREGRRVWHSHMVGVLPEYQNRGIGRLLKLHQREQALCAGIPAIEWTFDPLETRNAYFNIARLGVIVREYIPDCYGSTTSPLHGSLPTDRLLARWVLNSPRVEAALADAPPPATGAGRIEIAIPARIHELKKSGPARTLEVQAGLRCRMTDLFAGGYAVTGFRRGPETCEYILENYED